MDFDLWYHVAHQVAAQLYVDQAISKTVNLPKDAPVESVYTAYMLAWLGGLKGFTVYRDESKGAQVIVFGGSRAGRTGRLLKRREAGAPVRMAMPKRVLRKSEVARDRRLREVFEIEEVERGEEVVVQLTENSTCKTCEIGDLRVKEDVEGLFKYVESRYGRLDILVYSTGGPKPGGFFDISDDDWEDSFKLLTMSALRVSREAAKLMARGRWGRIVFIGSITLIRPLENLATSNIMRMPIVGLVRTLALELAKYNITVNAILPYDILTERVRQLAEADAKRLGVSFEEALKRRTSKVPLGRMGDPRDLGALVAFLASERASYITGALIPLDGGMHLSY
jgi:3-oxoacyl-[acyl-carrier protein] reductase